MCFKCDGLVDGAQRFSSRITKSTWMNKVFSFFFSFFIHFFNLWWFGHHFVFLVFFCRVYVFLLSELIIYEKNKNTLSLLSTSSSWSSPPPQQTYARQIQKWNKTICTRTHETRCLTRNCVLLLYCVVCILHIIFLSEKEKKKGNDYL